MNGVSADIDNELLVDQRKTFEARARHQRLFLELENHVQSLVRGSEQVRDEWFLYDAEPKLRPGKWSTDRKHESLDPGNFIKRLKSILYTFILKTVFTMNRSRILTTVIREMAMVM